MSVYNTQTRYADGTTTGASMQQSGFLCFQAESITDNIAINLWNTTRGSALGTVPISYSFDELYRTGSGFSARKFVWSGEVDLEIVTPAANLVGTYFKGQLPLNSWLSNPSQTITLNQLIGIADEVKSQGTSYRLASAMKNDILGSVTGSADTALSEPGSLLGAEMISYIILQTPSQSIETTGNRTFSLLGRITGNFGFFPQSGDAFLYNMFKLNPYSFGKSQLDDVPFNPLHIHLKPPTKKADLNRFERELPLAASETGINEGPEEGGMLTEFDILNPEERFFYKAIHISRVKATDVVRDHLAKGSISPDELRRIADDLDARPLQILPAVGAMVAGGLSFLHSQYGDNIKAFAQDFGRDMLDKAHRVIYDTLQKRTQNKRTRQLVPESMVNIPGVRAAQDPPIQGGNSAPWKKKQKGKGKKRGPVKQQGLNAKQTNNRN